jgi:methylmalonyl-CoA/ethylmalonyl-CoA epimerase
VEKERLSVPWVNCDEIQLRFAIDSTVLKHQVAASQTEIVSNLALNTRRFDVYLTACIQHHFRHNRFENLFKAGKVSEIRTKLTKAHKFHRYMKKLEHIGIAVKNLDESNQLFARLLGVAHYKIEDVKSEGVRTSFFQVGDIKIELLEATRADSPIAKFIEKRGEGIHHLAFDTDDLIRDMNAKMEDGFRSLSDEPKDGADNKLIAFLHPKSTNGVLIEMCSDKK